MKKKIKINIIKKNKYVKKNVIDYYYIKKNSKVYKNLILR